MSAEIIVAIVSGAFTFLGVVITVLVGNKKASAEIKEQTDLTLYRIKELEKQQNKHNNVMERTFKLEGAVKELQHEVADLKGFHGIGNGGGTR